MAIAFRAVSYLAVNSNTGSCDKPTGTVDDDVMLAFVTARSASVVPTITAPAGWTFLCGLNEGTNCRREVYWKTAASEGSSYAWSHDQTSSPILMVECASYSGCATGTPVNVYSNTAYITSDTTLRAAAVTPTVPVALLVFMGQVRTAETSISTPTGFTERLFLNDATTGYAAKIADRSWTNTTSGTVNSTLATSTTFKHAVLLALVPKVDQTVVAGVGIAGAGTIVGAVAADSSVLAPPAAAGADGIAGLNPGDRTVIAGVGIAGADGISGTVTASSAPTAPPGIASADGISGTGSASATRTAAVGIAGADGIVGSASVAAPSMYTIRILDNAGAFVGIIPALVTWRKRLVGSDVVDSAVIAPQQSLQDGTTEARLWMIDAGWQFLFAGGRYIIDEVDGDFETGLTLQATSAELVELSNYDTNYSPGPATYLNVVPSALMNAMLSGRVGRPVKNPGFGIINTLGFIDGTSKPTNWTWPTGWLSKMIANRLVWQADAGTDQSISDDLPCQKGVDYTFQLTVGTTAGTGYAFVYPMWQVDNGGWYADTDLGVAVYLDGAEHTVSTIQGPAQGNRVQLVLATLTTSAAVWFDDVRMFEVGPDSGWTYVGTAMDTRPALIPFNAGTIQRFGVWALDSTTIYGNFVGDRIVQIVNGPFVTVGFAAGGAGALANVTINGNPYHASGTTLVPGAGTIDVSAAISLTCSGLDPANSHIVEVAVATGTVKVTGFTVTTDNLVSMSWDYISHFEAIASLVKAVGGELSFDAVAKTITHVPKLGRDLTATNVVVFRRGANIVQLTKKENRKPIVNDLTMLCYGEGQYQLVVSAQAIGVNSDGHTSQDLYGVRRGKTANKDLKDLATAQAAVALMVEQVCWPTATYTVAVTDADAALCSPGDTIHFWYKDLSLDRRVLEVVRSNDGTQATLVVGDIGVTLEQLILNSQQNLATLQKSYQGVPTDSNISFGEDFVRSAGGTDTPGTVDFFIPYGSDLLDLRLRYQLGGLRATATGAASGGGVTSSSVTTPSGGGATTVSGGGSTTVSGGGSTTVSGGGSTTVSGGGSTSGTAAQDIASWVTPERDIVTNSAYGIYVPAMASSYATQWVYVAVSNYDASNHSYAVTIAGYTQYPTVSAGQTGVTALQITANTGTTVTVQQASGTANYKFNAVLTGYASHSHTTPDHTHPTPDHTHATPNHQHATPDHSHATPDHTHPAHTHTVAAHTHDLVYGLYESAIPATSRVALDGVIITDLNDLTVVSDFDLLPFIGKDSSGRVAEGWHTISFTSATNGATGSVRGALFSQRFLGTELI